MVDDLEAQGANGGGGPLGAPSAGGAEGDVGLQPPGGVAQLRHRVVVVGAAVVAVGDVQWGCVLLWEGGMGGGREGGRIHLRIPKFSFLVDRAELGGEK